MPQYKKAVIKSRLTQGIIFAKALHDAQESYYWANGQYASNQTQLDIEVKCPKDWTCIINNQKISMQLSSGLLPADNQVNIVYSHNHRTDAEDLAGMFYCHANGISAENICKLLGNRVEREIETSWVPYRLN